MKVIFLQQMAIVQKTAERMKNEKGISFEQSG